jgi:formiminoglutamate deiminase
VTSYWCEVAWVDDAPVDAVRVTIGADGRIEAVEHSAVPREDDVRLTGLVFPGFANSHSHAFHRALRGRTHADGGTFWTWREGMYAVAARLDPDAYLALARATYAEMALAGITCVGEFHYLHHGADGTPYDDPNAMGHALQQAAWEAGVRLTLLDAAYFKGGLTPDGHTLLDPTQRRFSDWNVDTWATRISKLEETEAVRIGVAAHSVRAVEKMDIGRIAAVAAERDGPMHVHVSEQPAENDACRGYYLSSPTELLEDEGAVGEHVTAVHGTHLSERDMKLLGASRTNVCLTPTTERDLADGIGPASDLVTAGAVLTLGPDQNAVIDMFEEARGIELDERLATLQRGRFRPAQLVRAATADGHRSLGWPDAGRLAVGARGDLVAVRLDSVRTAGCAPAQVVMAATAADVSDVIVDGQHVVTGGEHRLGDVGRLLRDAIEPLWAD